MQEIDDSSYVLFGIGKRLLFVVIGDKIHDAFVVHGPVVFGIQSRENRLPVVVVLLE